MKLPATRLLPLVLLASATFAAPLVNETFDQQPDVLFWNNRGCVVKDGKLHLNAEGDETSFVNAILEAREPIPGLNFSRQRITITLTDLELSGLSSSERQAFSIVIGSDKASEPTAAAYVRLVFNGDDKVILTVLGEKKDGRNLDRTIVSQSISYPVRQATLTLDRQGYELKITDAVSPVTIPGKWTNEIDWTAWENSAPRMLIKGVRRPSPGSVEATIGSFTIESK